MLTWLVLIFAFASLVHFAHNATYLAEYPNMPKWLTSAGVWLAWAAQVCVGVIGYLTVQSKFRLVGYAILAVYASFGFGGLDHYVVAPVSAHTIVMNVTIAAEAIAGLALLSYLIWMIASERKRALR